MKMESHEQRRNLVPMGESIPDDSACFHPRLEPSETGSGKLELVFTNTTLFMFGEKT
jgi:hypothetical protein